MFTKLGFCRLWIFYNTIQKQYEHKPEYKHNKIFIIFKKSNKTYNGVVCLGY